jgi:hypothetical protein
MGINFTKWLLLGLITIASVGCEPRPVVVNPDDADSTTILEEDDEVEVVPNATPDNSATPPADTGTDVDVGVGGGGVDVNVDRGAEANDAQPNANPNP